MKKVLTLACLLAVAHHVAAQCNSLPTYTETFVPACSPNDVYVKWPNYENQATYYQCNGVGNPVIVNCPTNQYFCYVLQQCVDCGQVIPAVSCSQLKTQNPPNCVPMGQGGNSTVSPTPSGPTLPTPNYPDTTATTKTTTTKTTTVKTTVSTVETPATDGPPTPPTASTPSGSTVSIPPPPSPVTNDPNIPMPPTPSPTPPSVPVTPPTIPSAPVAG